MIEWPEWTIHAAEVSGSERDLVLMQGVEPSLQLADVLRRGARHCGRPRCATVVTLGALLADVPHTRPTMVTGISADTELVARLGLQTTSYEGPTGIVGVLHSACRGRDIQSASLWASVPHYVAAAPNPRLRWRSSAASRACRAWRWRPARWRAPPRNTSATVSAAVASDPEVKAFVERLEQAMDEADEAAPPNPDRIPSAESIARDFQNFLRQRGPEG